LGIAYIAHFFITPGSMLTGQPELNGSWVNQFFVAIGQTRGSTYTECPQLDALAMQDYNNYYVNSNEVILTPMYLETDYIDGVASGTSYGVTEPYTYIQDLENNYTQIFAIEY
ncbi:MAG: hypothetical protein QXL94_08085, partial [Candidatus Parvarchaeum sp.]